MASKSGKVIQSQMRKPRGIKAKRSGGDPSAHAQKTHVTDLYNLGGGARYGADPADDIYDDEDNELHYSLGRLGTEEDWGKRRGDR